MNTTKDGEYMFLYWDGEPTAYYVRGHRPFAEARDTVAREEGIDTTGRQVLVRHRYGHWRWPNAMEAHLGCDHILAVHETPGRGRFKVTEVLLP